MKILVKTAFISLVLSAFLFAQSKSATTDILELNEKGVGKKIGTLTVKETKYGIEITVKASGLKSGKVGFHLHEKNDPKPTKNPDGSLLIGGGLGGHWDPDKTGVHAGPNGNGHRGDLEELIVKKDGTISQTVKSSRIKFSDIKGKGFVIHANPDNYMNEPVNGGTGARVYTALF